METQQSFPLHAVGYREPSPMSFTWPFIPLPADVTDPIRAQRYAQRLHDMLINGTV